MFRINYRILHQEFVQETQQETFSRSRVNVDVSKPPAYFVLSVALGSQVYRLFSHHTLRHMSKTSRYSVSNCQLNAQFVYSSTICMLHYDPQHVSSSTLLILRRTNCITTASGIVTLCKQPYSMHTLRLFAEGDDTRGCGDTICPPEDEQRAARNMLRIVV